MAILSVEHVTKRYDQTVAVSDVSFEARPGRILGVLGPNGAGKTSTIRMITHITVPDEGRVLYDGKPVGAWSQQRMGYLPEERGLYKKLKVREQLLYLGELKGLSPARAGEKVDYWLGRFGASDWGQKKTEGLSKGMQQKVQFIATLLHEPSLYIFDEPFSGLDPINAELLREIILELRTDDHTILFASHRMEQVEQMCDDICLMAGGEVVLQGALREVKSRYGRDAVVLEFEGDDSFLNEMEAAGQIRITQRSHRRADLRLLDGTPGQAVLEAAMQHADSIYHFELVTPPLNDIFVSVVGGDSRDREPTSAQPVASQKPVES